MATKKQKRERGLAKRAEFEAEVRADGLKAQAADRERRKAEEARMWDDAHKTHLKRNRFHDKCPNCAKVKAKQALDKIAKAAELKKAGVSDVDNIHLTEDEALVMDQESTERIKGILQEMGALHKADNTPIDLTRVEKVNA